MNELEFVEIKLEHGALTAANEYIARYGDTSAWALARVLQISIKEASELLAELTQ